MINRIIKEISKDGTTDFPAIFAKPHIQKIFREEFMLTDYEIKDLQLQIINTCEDIMRSMQMHTIRQHRNKSSNEQRKNNFDNSKSQELTNYQLKELEHYDELDYSQYPCQPCVRSLYYISKIAQSQQIKIIVPPTILLGFGDDNRMMFNESQSGKLVVKGGYISPKIISNFINKHMIQEQQSQSIEEKLTYPKFVIRLASKTSTKNEIKVYYSKDSVIADFMNFWGSYDMAIQIFVKQKHLRPSIYRYYMKNGNVFKSVAICNQTNLTKESRIYQTIINFIKEWSQKKTKLNENNYRPKTELLSKPKEQQGNKYIQESFAKIMAAKKTSISNDHSTFPTSDDYQLDQKGFPNSLEYFKLNDFYNELQTLFSNSEFKKYFTCTTDYVENMTMMNCRPGAQSQAEKMTNDLYRLFSQYYLKNKKFGNVSNFVCDFIEGENGLIYLLQVKSFQCEGLQYDWQIQWSPTKTGQQLKNSLKLAENEESPDFKNICQAQIICKEEYKENLYQMFLEACKESDHWIFYHKKNQNPKIDSKILDRYFQELHIGKENFLLQREKQRISPFYPLTTFSEFQFSQSQQSPNQRANKRALIINYFMPNEESKANKVIESKVKQQIENPNNQEVNCCLACHKIIDLFCSRHIALVFKTEQTMEELRKLKMRLKDSWTKENIVFLLSVYKNSKRSLGYGSELDKQKRRAHIKQILQRSKTPESVTERQTRNIKNGENVPIQFLKSITDFSQERFNITKNASSMKRFAIKSRVRKSLESTRENMQSLQVKPSSTKEATIRKISTLEEGLSDHKLYSRKQSEGLQKEGNTLQDNTPDQKQKSARQLKTISYNQDREEKLDWTQNQKKEIILKKSINGKELDNLISKFNLNLNGEEKDSRMPLISQNKTNLINNQSQLKQYLKNSDEKMKEQNMINNRNINISNTGRKLNTRVQDITDYFNNKRKILKYESPLSHRVRPDNQEKSDNNYQR